MKKIITVLIIISILFGLYKLLSKNPATVGVNENEADLILFWGEGCPHCEKVKSFILDHQLDRKIKISYKEVYYLKENQQLLTETIKNCPEIDSSQGIGVPLGFVRNSHQCLYGDEPIIEWLNHQ